jgi:hypothetical protein
MGPYEPSRRGVPWRSVMIFAARLASVLLLAVLSQARTASAAGHAVSLRLARDSTVSPACGIDQQSILARFGYLHPLALGTLGASLAWSRIETTGAPEQGATRTELSYALDF